jgi:hypothetical protein
MELPSKNISVLPSAVVRSRGVHVREMFGLGLGVA